MRERPQSCERVISDDAMFDGISRHPYSTKESVLFSFQQERVRRLRVYSSIVASLNDRLYSFDQQAGSTSCFNSTMTQTQALPTTTNQNSSQTKECGEAPLSSTGTSSPNGGPLSKEENEKLPAISTTLTTLDTTMDMAAFSVDASNEEEEEGVPEDELKRQRNRYIRIGVGLFLLAFIAFIVADSLTNKYIKSGMNSFLQWVEANPGGGVLVFMLVIFCTTMLFIPGVILTFGSGYVFANAFGLGIGILLGTIAVFVGASAGAILSFLLGRFLLRDCVAGLTKKFKLFEALDNAMEEKGLRIMVLLRLSPVIYASPYLNYGAGGMAVSFTAYTVSLLAILPATVMFVFLGASAGSLADSSGGNSKTTTIVLVIGIIFSVFAVALTTYYARQELQKVTAASRQPNNMSEEGGGDEETGEVDAVQEGHTMYHGEC